MLVWKCSDMSEQPRISTVTNISNDDNSENSKESSSKDTRLRTS